MTADPTIHGMLAEFETPEQLVAAARSAREAGYRRMEGYSPIPVEDLADALGHHATRVPAVVLAGGITGGVGGYFMQWFADVIHYPLNVGGRPLHSWPSFIPITFELTVLCASLSALVSMLAFNRLPRLHHPVFNAPGFEHASQDRFFLCIESVDAKFDPVATRTFLESLHPLQITEVES